MPFAFCLLPFFTRKFILHDYLAFLSIFNKDDKYKYKYKCLENQNVAKCVEVLFYTGQLFMRGTLGRITSLL
ncbi:MAG: hypothetical protein DWQ54_09020 [Microcystis flos-aquae TF09]|uniref:Uncharacterized protein n=1 Tax=Microcystis flos-aquae TF09 TaxID=2060473 RepID=A0A3E0L995_9CHRO|nr:MAG: hypothetical protein DWQ54_09020 [Microcystis flos-aquae TF09]